MEESDEINKRGIIRSVWVEELAGERRRAFVCATMTMDIMSSIFHNAKELDTFVIELLACRAKAFSTS